MGAKVHSQKGNSPDYKLKSINEIVVSKIVIIYCQLGCGLGGSHHLKKA